MVPGTSPDPIRAVGAAPAVRSAEVDTSDWPAQAADAIERAVGTVRDKTTGPAITVARAIVYGTFALLVGTAVAVLLAISFVRVLDVYLPDSVFGERHTWVAHLIVGGTFALAGMFAWSRRTGPAEGSE